MFRIGSLVRRQPLQHHTTRQLQYCLSSKSLSAIGKHDRLERPSTSIAALRAQETIFQELVHSARGCSFLSTLATKPPPSEDAELKRYLSPTSFPLGSFHNSQMSNVFTSVEQLLANDATPESVALAFALMNRMFQELQFIQSNHKNNNNNPATTINPLVRWSNVKHRGDHTTLPRAVVHAWRVRWRDQTTHISPKIVFHMLQQWEAYVPPDVFLPYKEVLHATVNPIKNASMTTTTTTTRPLELDLVDDMLQATIRQGSKHPKYAATILSSCNHVMEVWCKSNRGTADQVIPVRVQAILHKLIELRDNHPWLQVAPNLESYRLAMQAWMESANHGPTPLHQAQIPYRVDAIFRDMRFHGIFPNKAMFASMLQAWAQCEDREAPEHAYTLLNEMIRLYKLGVKSAKPNANSYWTVISAFADRGQVDRAEEILMEQVTLYQATRDYMYLINAACFQTVIHARSKQVQPQMAEGLLECMHLVARKWNEPMLLPDATTYNLVLSAWANSHLGNAPYRSEKLLHRMNLLYSEGYSEAKPNTNSFRLVLECWAKSPTKADPERAEALLRHVEQQPDNPEEPIKVDVHTYNIVLNIWSNSRRGDAAKRAQALFDELQLKYKAGGDDSRDLKPTLRTYTSLLTVWGRSAHRDRIEKAQAIFDAMVADYLAGDETLKPDGHIYNAMIDVWARAGHPEKAEAIHREMETNESCGTKPDIVSYNGVMKAWCQSGHADAGGKVQAWFDELLRSYQQGEQGMKPDGHSYSTLIAAWGRSRNPDKAQAVFDDMLAQHESDATMYKPDVATYNALIAAWAKAGQPERAEQVLRAMESSTTYRAKPNAISYNTAMNAWAQSGLAEAGERTQALFDEQLKKYETGHTAVKPDGRSYGALLTAWARTNSLEGATKAQVVFDGMVAGYQAGDEDQNPGTFHFKALIDGWTNAGRPEKVEQIVYQMEKPDFYAYSAAINAWSKSDSVEAGVRAQALFDAMNAKYKNGNQSLKPNLNLFGNLIKAWGKSKSPEGAAKAQDVFDDLVARFEAGDKSLQPSVYTYEFLLNAWAAAGVPEKAEECLYERDVWFKPNIIAYNKVMHSWSRSGLPEAAERAHELFAELQQYQDKDLKPDLYSFGTLITAYGRSPNNGASNAQAVFDAMLYLYQQEGENDLKPEIAQYNALVDAWGRAGDPEKAEQILREMETTTPFGVQPDGITYQIVVNAWCQLSSAFGAAENAALDRAHALYEEVKQKYQLGNVRLKPKAQLCEVILSAWCASSRPDAIAKAEQVFEDLVAIDTSGDTECHLLIDKFRDMIQTKKDDAPAF